MGRCETQQCQVTTQCCTWSKGRGRSCVHTHSCILFVCVTKLIYCVKTRSYKWTCPLLLFMYRWSSWRHSLSTDSLWRQDIQSENRMWTQIPRSPPLCPLCEQDQPEWCTQFKWCGEYSHCVMLPSLIHSHWYSGKKINSLSAIYNCLAGITLFKMRVKVILEDFNFSISSSLVSVLSAVLDLLLCNECISVTQPWTQP